MVQKISPLEFAKRFRHRVIEHSQPVTWFLGAGCSISSGIPGAASLVTRWVSELHEMQACDLSLEEWAKTEFEKYDPANPAKHYASVFARRHPASADRQREIEKICAGREPAYGYATFAEIMAHPQAGSLSNIVLTTNFDELVADALYLYGDKSRRPQVIIHEALAQFIRTRSPRPMVVKLHGDAMFDPHSLAEETARIDKEVAASLYSVLQDSALVFVGYGGNDQSVCAFLKAFAQRGLSNPVFWVGQNEPCKGMSEWLNSSSAIRVDHEDFDTLMHLIRGELDIDLVSKDQWLRGYDRYVEQFQKFEKELRRKPAGEAKEALQRASRAAEASLQDEWGWLLRADAAEASAPDTADELYRQGIGAYPGSVMLHGAYATFLGDVRKDMDGAEAHYKRALEADPNDANNLGNYSQLLLAAGRTSEGRVFLEKAMIGADLAKEGSLLAELHVYRLAHFSEQAKEAIAALGKLTAEGIRSEGWDFSSTLARAPVDGCAHLDLLKDIIDVVANGADPVALEKHDAWRSA